MASTCASRAMTVNQCKTTNCDQGIFFSNMEDSWIDRCSVTGTGQGYFFAGGARNGILNSEATACENGLHAQKESELLITGCNLTANTVCAARLDHSSITFVDNEVRNNWVGVMAYGSTACAILNNRFDQNQSCGLYLRAVAYSHITGNRFENSANSSIQAYGNLSGTTLTDNMLDVPLEKD